MCRNAEEAVWSSYDTILSTFVRSQEQDQLQPQQVTAVHEAEINLYLKDPILPVLTSAERNVRSNPLEWWRNNSHRFPSIAPHVPKYLTSPATSVYSERVFSEAGNVYEAKRNRLVPDTAGQLVFLKHNLRILDYNYSDEDD